MEKTQREMVDEMFAEIHRKQEEYSIAQFNERELIKRQLDDYKTTKAVAFAGLVIALIALAISIWK